MKLSGARDRLKASPATAVPTAAAAVAAVETENDGERHRLEGAAEAAETHRRESVSTSCLPPNSNLKRAPSPAEDGVRRGGGGGGDSRTDGEAQPLVASNVS